MKTLLNILLVSLFYLQANAGPGSSGGGMPKPPGFDCEEIGGKISLASYTSNMNLKETLEISHSTAKASLFQFGGHYVPFVFEGKYDRYGRFYGTSRTEGGQCTFQVQVSRYRCGFGREEIRMLIPFWANEYLYDPKAYGYDCKKAYDLNRDNAPSYRSFVQD